MQDHAADQLYTEEFFADDAPGRLAHVCKRLGQQIVQRFARLIPGLQLVRLGAQLLVRFGGIFRVKRFNFINQGFNFLQFMIAVRSEQLLKCFFEHICSSVIRRAARGAFKTWLRRDIPAERQA